MQKNEKLIFYKPMDEEINEINGTIPEKPTRQLLSGLGFWCSEVRYNYGIETLHPKTDLNEIIEIILKQGSNHSTHTTFQQLHRPRHPSLNHFLISNAKNKADSKSSANGTVEWLEERHYFEA
ncbi:8929_t:CDS:2 [Gigaspora margarita]|uniref:8929_t:CDS:1 n=1 Tax=Gigaspora margarita TaxID=4874 RepID=A0ABN7VT18_GIGMA|nr:8929_t:CDS:2 [Gigaspora margarita]